MPNIAIIWDFDQTLTPKDSTSKLIEILGYDGGEDAFWARINKLTSSKKAQWEHVLGSHAPAWMYSLSRFAEEQDIPLDADFFKTVIAPTIELYPNVLEFLQAIKNIQKEQSFKNQNIQIHHFIVSAGLKDLVEQIFPENLITKTFGCRYEVVVDEQGRAQNIPVFCMDETMKTRSLFEISKGSFEDEKKPVNKRVERKNRWAHFSDFIYIGDGPTDIPALSLTRNYGGLGVVVYDPKSNKDKRIKRLKNMSLDKRADLITSADFSLKGDLFQYLKARCHHIRQKYEAENFI